MKILLVIVVFLFFMAGGAYAFEDPRWESAAVVHPQSVSAPLPAKDHSVSPQDSDSCPEKSLYEIEKERKTLDVLKETPTPLRTPDTILRILVLPYTDTNNILHSFYYTYLKVEDGEWVIGDYLERETNKSKKMVLHHIDAPMPAGTLSDKTSDDAKPKQPPSYQSAPPISHSDKEGKETSDDGEGK